VSDLNKRSLWVTSIQPYPIDEESHIPTSICYNDSGSFQIGHSTSNLPDTNIINTNFKINLGEHTPGGGNNKNWACQDNKERTAYELSDTFISHALAKLEEELKSSGSSEQKIPAKILVAEPLNFSTHGNDKFSKTWMQNYRENIRRILHNYEEVDFLPEPFAVYQYYRYGQKIPHLRDKGKHIALVLDFGGGTFDACVIESTNQGDISLTGKHSKPLSADSCAIGGFEINARIAEYLIKKNLDGARKKEADACISAHKRVKSGDLNSNSLSEKKIAFIENLKKLEKDVEANKIALASLIKDWSLEGGAYERVSIKVPKDPFQIENWIDDEFFAHQFRKLFILSIWDSDLKKVIAKVLKNSKEKLGGKPVTVTLISGGSSNIKWLIKLLERDFADELEGATPVPISHSFQEVVSNGLAIECARRFYEEESEFVSVTYNPLKLHLRPDDEEEEQKRIFSSVGEKIDMDGAKPGDLMPSAQALHNFIGQKLQWKIKLSKPPKSQLRYTYFKPGLEDDEDTGEIYNLENQVLHTRDNKQFDSYVIVELLIREDGTAEPSFIYKSSNEKAGSSGNYVKGREFAIDMTTGISTPKSLKNYVGFDFGSSCSSVCLLSQDQVKVTAARAGDAAWVSLSESISLLPFPVAFPLKKYLDVRSTSNPAAAAREAFEAGLALLSYVAAAELYSLDAGQASAILRSFQHRSMGPLKGLLRQAIDKLGKNCKFSKPSKNFLEKNEEALNKAIEDFNNHKHEKLEDKDFDYHSHLTLVIAACVKLINDKLFGYVLDTEPKPFEEDTFQGMFKVAHDVPPFTDSFPYESNKQSNRTQALLHDMETKETLPLFPFIFWNDNAMSAYGLECYWFDKGHKLGDDPVVKPCDKRSESSASDINPKLPSGIVHALSDRSKSFSIFHMQLEADQE